MINGTHCIKIPTQWEQLNKEWKACKEPQKQFCKKRNISYAGFIHWRSKLNNAQSNNINKANFQEIKITPQKTVIAEVAPTIKINLPGDLVITIPLKINTHILIRLLQALRGADYA